MYVRETKREFTREVVIQPPTHRSRTLHKPTPDSYWARNRRPRHLRSLLHDCRVRFVHTQQHWSSGIDCGLQKPVVVRVELLKGNHKDKCVEDIGMLRIGFTHALVDIIVSLRTKSDRALCEGYQDNNTDTS